MNANELDEDRSSLISLEKDIQSGGPFAPCVFLIRFAYNFALLIRRPSWWALINIITYTQGSPQTEEILDQPSKLAYFVKILKGVLLVVFFLAMLPFAVLALVILLPLQFVRPRAYSYVAPHSSRSSRSGSYVQFGSTGFPHNQGFPLLQNVGSRGSSVNSLMAGSNVNLLTTSLYTPHIRFKVVSSNLCLGPKFMSFANNLDTSEKRCGKICSFFTSDSAATARDHVYSLGLDNENHNSNVSGLEATSRDGGSVSTLWSVASKEKVISNHSSVSSDFLCLQEVFCPSAAGKLIDSLKGKYPYIVHDVSWPLHDWKVSFLSSGLFMASKYPFVDISFRSFKDGITSDRLACKGVLMTKVFLGIHKGKDMVGILSTTHLQAWTNDQASKTRCKQLNCVTKWIEEFRRRSRKRQRNVQERIVFDVVTGDFNFDRTSHCDKNEQDCELLKDYQDPCMDENGQLHNWAIGTECVQARMHDQNIRTPSNFQKMLVSELERCQFLASTKEERNQEGEDGKRKIDYILYRESPGIRTSVQGFRFHASLASLSDHIPISTTFLCQIAET